MIEELNIQRFRSEPVGIATGGESLEREISLKTGAAFEKALVNRGYDVTVYDVPEDLEALAADRPAAVLLGIHGGLGEGGALQGFLESLNIPYTGSGVLASALAMDKHRTRRLCAAEGVPVADAVWCAGSQLHESPRLVERASEEVGFPVVAKLNDAGSSFGVHICEDARQLENALQQLAQHVGDGASSGVLIEQMVEGPEYTVGFFDQECLGVMEIRPAEGFYDVEAKYESEDTEYIVVDDPAICEPLVGWSRTVLDAVGCRGVARVDFKGAVAESGPVVMLEVNTIPGMTATSLVPKMAADRGVEFDEFVEAMVAAAKTDADQQ